MTTAPIRPDAGPQHADHFAALDAASPPATRRIGLDALAGLSIAGLLIPEAVAYATYLKNRSPTRALDDKTPDEVFWGKKPDISPLEEFGSKCWVLRQDGQVHKLQEKSRQFPFSLLIFHWQDLHRRTRFH